MNKIISALLVSMILLGGLLFIGYSGSVLAFDPLAGTKTVCDQAPAGAPPSSVCQSGGGTNPIAGPNGILLKAVNIFSIVTGIAAIIVIIIGGLKYVLSSGDSSNVNSAKNTILYAVIGLVVVVLAQAIVRFVISKI